MSNITIMLGGKERALRFSFLSLKALETHYGKSISKVFDEEIAKGGLAELTVMLWACLRKEKLTIGKVDELIDDSIENEEITMEELSERLQSALSESKIIKSQAKEDEDPNAPKTEA
jgi:hypothetical protein